MDAIYESSVRPLPKHLPAYRYPRELFTYRVPNNGTLPWRGTNLYISDCLAKQEIALCPTDEWHWDVFFCSIKLGTIEPTRSGTYTFNRVRRVLPMS